METLRTPFPLTPEMQAEFYRQIICNRSITHRYWSVRADSVACLAFGGITDIHWENRTGEISLIVDPARQREGIGKQAAVLLLQDAFERLNLNLVYGECYLCNPNWKFWEALTDEFKGFTAILPGRKFWAGKYHGALYFSIDANQWSENRAG